MVSTRNIQNLRRKILIRIEIFHKWMLKCKKKKKDGKGEEGHSCSQAPTPILLLGE